MVLAEDGLLGFARVVIRDLLLVKQLFYGLYLSLGNPLGQLKLMHLRQRHLPFKLVVLNVSVHESDFYFCIKIHSINYLRLLFLLFHLNSFPSLLPFFLN